MGYVHLPVRNWRISLFFMAGSNDHLEQFQTVAQLRAYFEKHPYIANKIGGKFKLTEHHNLAKSLVHDVKLSFQFNDAISYVSKDFDSVQKFAEFFDEHPELADCVGYLKKKK